jgi:hypothetical protein
VIGWAIGRDRPGAPGHRVVCGGRHAPECAVVEDRRAVARASGRMDVQRCWIGRRTDRWMPRSRRLAAILVIGALVAGCDASAAPSAPVSPEPTSAASAPAPSAEPGSLPVASPSEAAGTPSPTPNPTASPTPSPAPTPAPTSTPLSSATVTVEGWSPIVGQAAVDGVQMQNIVWTGIRFVADGVALVGGGVFLDSSGGRAWRVTDAPGARAASGPADASPGRLAAGREGIVAVGGRTASSPPDPLASVAAGAGSGRRRVVAPGAAMPPTRHSTALARTRLPSPLTSR